MTGGQIGPSTAAVVTVLTEMNAFCRLRQAQGVVALADEHGGVRLEAAYRRALA